MNSATVIVFSTLILAAVHARISVGGDRKISTGAHIKSSHKPIGMALLNNKESDDAIFNFISRLLTTMQKSSEIAAKRAKNSIEKRRKLTEEIDDILTKISDQP